MFLSQKWEISYREKEDDIKLRLKNKLAGYTPEQKKEILQQMMKRRQYQTQPLLQSLKTKEEQILKSIDKKQALKRPVQLYKSQILEGQALCQFNKILHFSFEKERQQQSSPNLQQNKQQNCPICYENFEKDILVTQPYICIHIFHTKCIEQWFKSKQIKPNCPVCRTNNIQNYECVKQLNKLQKKIHQVQEKQQFLQSKFQSYLLK